MYAASPRHSESWRALSHLGRKLGGKVRQTFTQVCGFARVHGVKRNRVSPEVDVVRNSPSADPNPFRRHDADEPIVINNGDACPGLARKALNVTDSISMVASSGGHLSVSQPH